jgi:hypothetical protein
MLRCLRSRTEGRRNNHSKFCRNDKTSNLQQMSLTFWTSSIVSGLKKSTTFRRTNLFPLPVEREEEYLTWWVIYKELVCVTGPVKVVAYLAWVDAKCPKYVMSVTIRHRLNASNLTKHFNFVLYLSTSSTYGSPAENILFLVQVTLRKVEILSEAAIVRHPTSQSLEYLWLT